MKPFVLADSRKRLLGLTLALALPVISAFAGQCRDGTKSSTSRPVTGKMATSQTVSSKASTGKASAVSGNNKLFGQVSVFGSACLSSGFRPESTQLPTTVEQVKMGTPAFNAGLAVGDRILSAQIGDNLLRLRIERSGKQYELSLRARTDVRFDGSDSAQNLSAASVDLKSNLFAQLRNYRISFIIDRSGSMSRPLGDTGKTVWNWVKEQFSGFAEQVENANHQPFDLVLFADNYNLELARSASQVRTLLSEAVTTGDTNIKAPLVAYLAQVNVSTSRPLLLIIVTDGKAVSASSTELTAALTAACRQGKPGMKVLFLQTGYSQEGQRFALELSSALKAGGLQGVAGAADFGQIEKSGLAGLLKPLF
ncbi:MAG: VWA domain-containing protein [Candidatus Obscuribacterales bacterium]|nr:VWA domain-containing protein [Candidatus Obscuribacterales bacterium]